MDSVKLKRFRVVTLRKNTDSYVFLLLYVNDMLIAGSSIRENNNLKTRLSAAFKMNDLGPAKQILGIINVVEFFRSYLIDFH